MHVFPQACSRQECLPWPTSLLWAVSRLAITRCLSFRCTSELDSIPWSYLAVVRASGGDRYGCAGCRRWATKRRIQRRAPDLTDDLVNAVVIAVKSGMLLPSWKK